MFSFVNDGIIYFMNILYCGDQGIARGTLVSILSILKYNTGPIHFYIATIRYEKVKPFTEKSAKFLDELVKKTNAKSFVKLIDATEVFVKNLPSKNKVVANSAIILLRWRQLLSSLFSQMDKVQFFG